MPAIPYAADGSIWTAENLNDLYAEADRKVSAVLTGKSLFMARRWTMSGLPLGRLVTFTGTSTMAPRRMSAGIWDIPGSASWPANHDQAAVPTELAKIEGGLEAFGYKRVLDGDRKVAFCDRYLNETGFPPSACPDLSILMGSMIPLTVDVDFTTYSIGVGIDETTPAGKASCANQGGSAGFRWHFRAHPLAVAELCFDGVTTFTVPATWTRFNLFRIHNLQPRELTVTFEVPGDDITLTLAPWDSRTVRRLADGSILHEWEEGVPCRYFWPYVSGDAAFWRAGGGDSRLGDELADLPPESTLAASNLGNVSLLVEWFNALGQEMDPSVAPDISGVYGGFFGHPSTGLMGDLAHQFGRIQRIRSASGVWNLQAETFVSDAAGVATALSAVGGTADGFGNWTMPYGDALDGPGCSLFGASPITSGTVWPGTAPGIPPHDARGDFLPGWQLWTFATGSAGTWRSGYKTSTAATVASTFTTPAADVHDDASALATCSGWTLTPFGWSFSVSQSTDLVSGFDLIPFGSVFDTLGSSSTAWTRRLWFTPGRDGSGRGTFPDLSCPAVIPPGGWMYLLKSSGQNEADNQWAEWDGGKWIGSNGTADAGVNPQDIVVLGDRVRVVSPPLGSTDGRKALFPDPVGVFRHPSSSPFPLPSGTGGALFLRIPLSAWQWDVLAYVCNAWTRGTLQVDWFDFPIRWRVDGTGDWVPWQPLASGLVAEFDSFNAIYHPDDPVFYRVPAAGMFRANTSIADSFPVSTATATYTMLNDDLTLSSRNLSYIPTAGFLTYMSGQGLHGLAVKFLSGLIHPGGENYVAYPGGPTAGTTSAGTASRVVGASHDGTVTWDYDFADRPATLTTSPAWPLNVFSENLGKFGRLKVAFPEGEDGFVFIQTLPSGWTSGVRLVRDTWRENSSDAVIETGMDSVAVTADATFQNQGNSRDTSGANIGSANVIQTFVDLSFVDLS